MDRVSLKESPWKGLTRFGMKGKLKPKYIGPFEILQQVGEATYKLTLPPKLLHVYGVFQIVTLKKYKSGLT